MDLLEGHLEEGQVLVPLQENRWRHRIRRKMMSNVLSYPLVPTVQCCLYAFRGVNQEGNLLFAIHLDNKQTTVVHASVASYMIYHKIVLVCLRKKHLRERPSP